MDEFLVNPAADYPRTARTVLSGNEKSLTKTFERIRSEKDLANVVKITDQQNILYSARINLDVEEGTGYWEFVQLSEELYIIATDCQYFNTHAETILGEDFLEFHFKVSGELLMELSDDLKISIRGPSLLIYKQPKECIVKEWIMGGARESSLTLYCKKSLFTDKLGMSSNQLPGIVESFISGKNKSNI